MFWRQQRVTVRTDQQLTTHREVTNTEGRDVSDAGDGDGDPGVSHRLGDDLTDGQDLVLVGPLDIVETLNYHEHVIDPNP